ncbi:MAG: YdcF family protein [Polyangiaceae bacterium]
MFFVLSKLLDVLLSPLTWAIALVALAAPWRLSRPKKPKRQRILLAGALAVLLVFSYAPVPNALVAILESSAKDTTTKDAPYDAVVLLGGMVEDASSPSGGAEYNERIERLLVTYDWLREDRAKVAILSGGPVYEGGLVEAERLRDQLVSWGIDPERLIVEGRSVNTRENALFTAEIVKAHGFGRIAIVTSAFHMKRALGCFRAVGLEPDTLPVDYGTGRWGKVFLGLPRAQHFEASTRAIRELFGRFVYWVSGYTKG